MCFSETVLNGSSPSKSPCAAEVIREILCIEQHLHHNKRAESCFGAFGLFLGCVYFWLAVAQIQTPFVLQHNL